MKKKRKVPGVGFEPTQLALADLKSAPLDHSGIQASLLLMYNLMSLSSFKEVKNVIK